MKYYKFDELEFRISNGKGPFYCIQARVVPPQWIQWLEKYVGIISSYYNVYDFSGTLIQKRDKVELSNDMKVLEKYLHYVEVGDGFMVLLPTGLNDRANKVK